MPQINLPDTRIALGGSSRGEGGGSSNPFQTFGQILQLKDVRDQMETRRMQMEKLRQAEEDDHAIRSTLGHYGNPDDAIGDLYKQGRYSAANLLGKQVYDHRKAQADAYQQQLDNYNKRLKVAGNIMSGATDDASYKTARDAVVSVLQPIFGQGLNDILPTVYDKGHVDNLLKMGMDAQERNQVEQNAVTNAREAIRLQNQTANDNETYKKNQLEARKYWQGALSTGLGNARNQSEWDFWQEQAVTNGAPKDLVAGFGRQWSAENAAHAKSLGMTSAQDEAAARADANAARADRRLTLAEEAAARAQANFEAGGAGGGKGKLPPATQSVVARNTADDYAKLETEIRDAHMIQAGEHRGEWNPIPPALQEEYGRRRMRIANADRAAKMLPTYEESIAQAEAKGDTAGASKLKAEMNNLKYGGTTGKKPDETGAATTTTKAAPPPAKSSTIQQDAARADQLLAQLERLKKDPKADPATKAKVQTELREILKRIQPTPTAR